MKIFHNWDELAWVRRSFRNSSTLNGNGNTNKFYFKPALVPISSHPLVTKDLSVILQIYHLYAYLRSTESLEVMIINPAISCLIGNGSLVGLSTELLECAYKIYTDEAFHALESCRLRIIVSSITNVQDDINWYVPQNVGLVEKSLESFNTNDRVIAQILACCVNETLISSNLLQANDPKLHSAVSQYIARHASDESKHHLYFARLFKHIWQRFSSNEMEKFGCSLPLFIKSFLSVDFTTQQLMLRQVGFSEAESEQVTYESNDLENHKLSLNKAAQQTLKIFREAGVFDNYIVREAFLDNGFNFNHIN